MPTSFVQLSPKKVTLTSVRLQLTQWRAKRVKGSRIPKPLWQDITSITTARNYENVATVLNIHPERLRKEAGLLPENDPDTKSPFPFAEVSPVSFSGGSLDFFEQKKESSSHNTGILEVTRTNGTCLKVSGLEKEALLSLLQQIC